MIGSNSSRVTIEQPLSVIDWLQYGQTNAITRNAGDFTVGFELSAQQFYSGIVCRRVIGIRIYVVASGTETFNLSLWDNAGTLHETKAVSVSSTGRQQGLFTTPFTPTLMRSFRIGMRNATNSFYTAALTPTNAISTVAIVGGMRIESAGLYAMGAARPAVSAATERYPIECIWE